MRIPLPSVQPTRPAGAVGDSGTPGVRITDPMGGVAASVGESLTKLGVTIGEKAAELQGIYNHARAKQGVLLFAERAGALLNDPQRGYLQQIGAGAASQAAYDDVTKGLEDAAHEFVGMLDNPEQQQLYSDAVRVQLLGMHEQVARHFGEQTRVFAAGRATAMIDLSRNQAIDAYTQDPQPGTPSAATYAAHVDTINQEIDVKAKTLGWSDAQREAERVKQLSKLHEGVVERLVAQHKTPQARLYLQGATHLAAETGTRLADLVTQASTAEAGAEVGAELVARYRGNLATMSANAQAEIDRRQDLPIEVKNAASHYVRDRRAVLQDQAADMGKQALADTEAWLAQPANRGATVDSPRFPTYLRYTLEKQGMLDAARRFGDARPSDAHVMAGLYRMAETGALRGVRPSELVLRYRNALDDHDWNIVLQMHAAANQPVEASDLSSFFTPAQRLREALVKSNDIERDPGPAREATNEARFNNALRNLELRVRSKEARLGHKLLVEELQDEIDNVVLHDRVMVTAGSPGGLFGSTGTMRSASTFIPGTERPYVDIDGTGKYVFGTEVPDDVRAEIVHRQLFAQQPVNEDLVIRAWVAGGKPANRAALLQTDPRSPAFAAYAQRVRELQ